MTEFIIKNGIQVRNLIDYITPLPCNIFLEPQKFLRWYMPSITTAQLIYLIPRIPVGLPINKQTLEDWIFK